MLRQIFYVLMLILCAMPVSAQAPAWIGNTPKELNYTYRFIEIVSSGPTMELARHDAIDRLTDSQQLADGVRVSRNTNEHTNIDKTRINNGPLQSQMQQNVAIDLTVDGERYNLQAIRVDEYATVKDGQINLHTLFQVATCDNPVFDNVYVTDKYGFTPVVMSLIPGAGQMYKGSYLKGGCILGSEIICAVGIILCENQRSDYSNKAKEQPRFAKEYNTKANNWATGRNVCIGVAGAIYVYNLIDAAVSKGARRIKIKRSGYADFSYRPCLLLDETNRINAGICFSYNF